jgi:hypothetical protein
MRQNAQQVAHRAGRDEEAGRLAHACGSKLLQASDGGIAFPAVIAELGAGEIFHHLRRGPGDSVAAEID